MRKPLPANLICICIILFAVYPLQSQDLEWAFSKGGHSTERAKSVEKVPGGVVFLSSDGLEKRNESGERIWKFDFFDRDDYQYSSNLSLGTITVDRQGNIYAQLTFPTNGPGPTTISNIDIPHGNSLIKINSDGELLWCRKLEGSKEIMLEYHNGNVYVIGTFDDMINIDDTFIFENSENTDCDTNYESIYARDIFMARFNTIGQVQDAVKYGGPAHDDLKALTSDNNGNLYLAVNYSFASCTVAETQLHKISPDFKAIWKKTISKQYEEGNGYNILLPTDIHIGVNGKLYLWAYAQNTVISNDYRFIRTAPYGETGGLIEYSAEDGTFFNYRSFDGLSIYGQRGYMADYKEHLLVATTFRGTKEFDNGSLSTTNDGEEPVLIKVNLNNFGMEYLMHLSGIPQEYHSTVKDWSGPIQVNADYLYYSGNFSTGTLNLSPSVVLTNNSGNNDQDYFLTQYNLSTANFTNSARDDDEDGVQNWMDKCPNTPLGETTDEFGCSVGEKDSDLDGVTDDLDKCGDTSPNSEVNAEGCSSEQIDNDGDGIPDFRDSCLDSEIGVLVDEEGCQVAILDPNSFQIETIGEACKDKGNGSINIQTQDNSRVYRAVLNGTQEISFTGTTRIEGLKAGQYELCILAHEATSDMLCYTLTIEAGTEISLSGKVNLNARTLNLELSGGTIYKIKFNNQILETTSSSLELDLKEGINQVYVTTDRPCQGTATYKVDMGSALRVAPNPFIDKIELSEIQSWVAVEVNIYNQSGQQVYHKTFGPGESVVIKDLSQLTSGTYLLEYSGGNTRYIQKIIKR